jgi:hypothetical protein
VQLVRNVQALEQDRRVALRRVAVFFADDALELGQADAILVTELRLCVENLARLQRLPEPRIAHDDGVDDPKGVERELILAQHTELVRPDDGAFLGQGFAGQELHERGLARPVGSGEPIAAPF